MADPVSMFGPDGQVHDVQPSDVQAALASNGEYAHAMLAPDGTQRWVRHSDLGAALRSGGLPIGATPKAPQVDMQEIPTALQRFQQEGVRERLSDVSGSLAAVGEAAKGAGKGVLKTVGNMGTYGPSGTYSSAINMAGLGGGASPSTPQEPPKPDLPNIQQKVGYYGEGAAEIVAPFLKAGEALPSAKAASGIFNHLKTVIPDLAVNTEGSQAIASRIMELGERGGTPPKVVTDFVNRITKPGAKPLTYAEAQDFIQAASKLSAQEMANTTGVMGHNVREFAGQLRSDISSAVHGQSEGLGSLYDQAVKSYAQASAIKQFAKKAGVAALKYGGAGALAGATADAGYQAAKRILP